MSNYTKSTNFAVKDGLVTGNPAKIIKGTEIDTELRLQNISRPIEVLINNAGFGINKSFTTSDVAEEIALLDVLVTAPMRLMHAVLPAMKDRNSGIIS